jgi:hypothetical protein
MAISAIFSHVLSVNEARSIAICALAHSWCAAYFVRCTTRRLRGWPKKRRVISVGCDCVGFARCDREHHSLEWWDLTLVAPPRGPLISAGTQLRRHVRPKGNAKNYFRVITVGSQERIHVDQSPRRTFVRSTLHSWRSGSSGTTGPPSSLASDGIALGFVGAFAVRTL